MTDDNTPDWFSQAINTPCQTHRVDADNCPVAFQSWGDPQKPGLLFMHGNGAHAHWWDFIAPFFADDYYVVAPDFSGMGNSGHRDAYNSALYVDEIKTVVDAAHFIDKPLLIGHSMGGRMVFNAEQKYPDAFFGVIMADAPFHHPDHVFNFDERRKKPVKPHRVYPTLETAMERFRLFPAQACENQYILDYIARHSLKQVDGGWQWKFDPKIYSQLDYETFLSTTPKPGDKILAMIYGEESALLYPENLQHNLALFEEMGFPEPIGIPNARHHLFLDQPLAFIYLIKDLLTLFHY